ncbi:MAG: leucyl aminopeptidase [Alphaproteobacteria bacterium]|nr:leucyl aminopeptidase [Alphaproteobacteria bacterium]
MKISFVNKNKELNDTGAIAVSVFKGNILSDTAKKLDEKTGGAITRAIKTSMFEGKIEQVMTIIAPAGTNFTKIICIGLGSLEKINVLKMQDFGGRAFASFSKEKTGIIAVDGISDCEMSQAEMSSNAAFGAKLASYKFDKYQTENKDSKLKKLKILTDSEAIARKAFKSLNAVADGVFLSRDLVSEPPNVIYPTSFAAEAEKLVELGVEVEILDKNKMNKLGMNMLLAVGQGSMHEPKLVVMHWKGAENKETPPVAFVGKGVCFDSGGISIKPSGGMEDMKCDMAGAGVVTGLMKALARRKAKANVVGVIGLVENMPSGYALKPSDIITSMSGKTVEIVNTDAEGRLVLGDAMWYVQERFKPTAMIDIATLTGAIIVSLGNEKAGLFSNDNNLAKQLYDAGNYTKEKLWRFPLDKEYDKLIKSDVADMKNIGGRTAGSITAAQFLKRFVKDTAWAHIDIAGVSWSKKAAPTVPKGATAFGVQLLNKFITDNYET